MRRRLTFVLGVLGILFGASNVFAQTRVITGNVSDALTNDPLSGVRVEALGTTTSTLTDADGNFNIGVPVTASELLIRRIGYRAVAVNLAGVNDVQVQLQADIFRLEEIVVTGQATGIVRRNLANAVSTVSGTDLQRVPAASIEMALVGKVAGANIQQNSGSPGGGVQVELRGVSSINANAQPLYVIDGIIVSDVAIPSNTNAVTRAASGSNASSVQDGQVNRIVDINPHDIENIEILKGASASAIYGSKASNGVIIITTRRGRVGRPQIRLSQRFGTFRRSNSIGMRNFADAAAIDDAFGAGTSAGFTNERFDLEELLAGRGALSTETSASVSGGTPTTRYFMSGLWKSDEGIMENTGFDKQSLRLNIDQDLGNIRVAVSSNLIHTLARRGLTNNDNAGVSPYMVFAFTPNFVDLSQNADGTYPDNPFERSNPLQTLSLMTNIEDVWRFMGSARIEFDAMTSENSSLRFIGVGGVDRFSQNNELLFPRELQFEDDDGLPGTSLFTTSSNENINIGLNAIFNYSPVNGSMSSTSSFGLQYETRDLNIVRITARNIASGLGHINAGTNVQVFENRARVEDFGFFLQEELLLNDRFLLTAGLRADQSSTNSASDDIFVYPKAAASYRFDMDGFFSGLKIRGAYGEAGNQPNAVARFTSYNATANIEGSPGLQVSGPIADSDLRPERQREFEFGVDIEFGDARATLEATAFTRTVSDLILTRTLAPSRGYTFETFNGGEMRVRGFEAALNLVAAQSPNMTWIVRTTFSLNRSKITNLPVPAFVPANAGFGTGLGAFFIEEGASATQIVGPQPDCASGRNFCRVGDSNPDFRASFINDLSFGSLNLFFLLDWQKGSDIINLTRLLFDAGGNSIDYDDPGTDGNPLGLSRLIAFGVDGTTYLESASFLKMRELTLSWDIPESVFSSLWGAVDTARLTFSVRNVFTITNYSGIDPEVSNFGNQAVGRNIDVAPFPPSRSFWLGINLGL